MSTAVATERKTIVDCKVRFTITSYEPSFDLNELSRLARQAVEYRLQRNEIMKNYQIIEVNQIPNEKKFDVDVLIAIHMGNQSDEEAKKEVLLLLAERFERIQTFHQYDISQMEVRKLG